MAEMIGDNFRRQAALFEHEAEAPAPAPVSVEGPFAGVVFNRPVDQVFSYRIPAGLRAKVVPGQRVRVPLGRGNAPSVGYCVRLDDSAEVDPRKIKDVIDVLDDPPLIDGAMLELTRWIAGYYSCTWGQALDAVVPAGVKKQAGTARLEVSDRPRVDAGEESGRLAQGQLEAGRGDRRHRRGRASP